MIKLNTQPEKKFSAGAIHVSVWKNEGTSKDGQKKEFRSISLQRRYTDKEGNWKSTNSFRINDLPRAALALTKAYEYIVLKEQSQEIVEEIVM